MSDSASQDVPLLRPLVGLVAALLAATLPFAAVPFAAVLSAAVLSAAVLSAATPASAADPPAGEAASEASPAQPVIVPPAMLEFASAVLPEGAAELAPPDATSIDVVVVITIGIDGLVSDAEIRAGAGEPFDSAALAACRKFVFRPARVDGQPVAVKVPYTYVFEIERKVIEKTVVEEPPAEPERERGEGVVAGGIAERGTRSPLAAILITIEASDGRKWPPINDITDSGGRFRFEDLPDGKYRIRAFLTGDKEVRGAATVRAGGEVEVGWLYGRKGRVSQYRTVVRARNTERSVSKMELEEIELKSVPGTGGEPTRVVATLPGVARSPLGLPYYVVRGADFESTGQLIDGFDSYLLYHLFAGPAVIPAEFIGSLDFYPGGFPSEYGRYSAGLVAVETRDPPRDTWHFTAVIDLMNGQGLFSVPFADGKGILSAGLRWSWGGFLIGLMFPETGIKQLIFWDYQLRLTYDFTADTRLTIFLMGAGDHLEVTDRESSSAFEQEGGRALFGSNFHRVSTRFSHQLTPQLRLQTDTLLGYVGFDYNQATPGQPLLRFTTDSLIVAQRAKVMYRHRELSAAVGVDFNGFHLSADLAIPPWPSIGEFPKPSDDAEQFIGDLRVDEFDTALWMEIGYEPIDGLKIIPGLRVDFFHWNGSTHVTADPRLAIRANITDWLTLKAGAGLFREAPQIGEIDKTFGNPTLGPISALQSSFGAELRFGEDREWQFDITGFYNTMYDLPVISDQVDQEADGELGRLNYTNLGRGRSWGLEFMFRKRVGKYMFGWLTYTLSRAERNYGQAFDNDQDGGGGSIGTTIGEWRPFAFDQTHVLNLAWTVLLPADMTIALRFRLTTGNPTPKIVGATYDADADRYQPHYRGIDRMPVFHQLDIRFDKKFVFDTFILDFYIEVQNLYYARNAEFWIYEFDYSKRIVFGGIPILPTIGLKWSF